MSRQFEDMVEPANEQALAEVQVPEFVQTVRKFNAAAKAYVTMTAFGLTGKANPAFNDVFEWGQKVDEVLSRLYPMDYAPEDATDDQRQSEIDQFMLDNLIRALSAQER